MSKNITFEADEALIEEAQEAARAANTTLNDLFRLWLDHYVREHRVQKFEQLMTTIRGKVVIGRKPSRDEMNER